MYASREQAVGQGISTHDAVYIINKIVTIDGLDGLIQLEHQDQMILKWRGFKVDGFRSPEFDVQGRPEVQGPGNRPSVDIHLFLGCVIHSQRRSSTIMPLRPVSSLPYQPLGGNCSCSIQAGRIQIGNLTAKDPERTQFQGFVKDRESDPTGNHTRHIRLGFCLCDSAEQLWVGSVVDNKKPGNCV